MENVKRYIYEQVARQRLSKEEAKKLLKELQTRKEDRIDDHIAIIGIAGRFPGADSVDEYWNNIINDVNCIGDYSSKRRRDVDDFLKKHLGNEDIDLAKVYRKGGFLSEIDKFDAGFFRISPREAKSMDPIQRLFLETAWQALEDAGYGGEQIYGTRTGVYVGKDHTTESTYRKINPEKGGLALTGVWTGILASRISYIFNFKGPAVVIDTACSSGLVAVHAAAQALKNNECEMAIAGGIALSLLPIKSEGMQMVESTDYKVRTFDKKANGTVWGEGVGAVILKPMKRAVADGDNIYAVIKGSAINNDGASNGITAPNAEAQEEIILKAWKDGGINPETISYIEAHGTGTMLGDPIEIKGLTNAFRKYTNKKQFCGIGSIKTSIGHLVAASGLASLIKVVLALKNNVLPPSINFEEPNPYINFCDSPLYILDKPVKWDRGEVPRRAGLSAFGFSGTNCHIVIEEAPLREREKKEVPFYLLTLSARNEDVLKNLVWNYRKFLETEKNTDPGDICYTASIGRGHYNYRLAVIFKDLAELNKKIKLLCQRDWTDINIEGVYYGEHRIVSAQRKVKELFEITEGEKRQLTQAAKQKIKHVVKDGDFKEILLQELAELYVKGADINWVEFYQNNHYQRVNIPQYPLERIRYWVESSSIQEVSFKKSPGYEKEINHPLLDNCLADSVTQKIYRTIFSADNHWVLKDHKVLGNYVVPGTTYLEMARAAATLDNEGKYVELSDVVFLTPLVVNEGEEKEVHTIIDKEKNPIEFMVASKGMMGWVKHAIGKIAYFDENLNTFDLDEIKKEFTQEINVPGDSTDTAPFEFGARWKIAKKGVTGERGGLIELTLPEELENDVKEFGLHPSLLDNAVNLAIRVFGEGLYLPFTYKKARIYKNIPARFYSYLQKRKKEDENLETISFDITLLTLNGEVIADIENYSIKKVHRAERKFKELAGKGNSYYEIGWIPFEKKGLNKVTEIEKVLVFKDEKGLTKELINKLSIPSQKIIEVEFGQKFLSPEDNYYIISGKEEDYVRLLDEVKEGLTHIIHLSTIVKEQDITDYSSLQEMKLKGVYSLFYLARAIVKNKIKDKLKIFLISDYVNSVTNKELIKPHNGSLFGLGKVISQELTNVSCYALDIDDIATAEDIVPGLVDENRPYQLVLREGQFYWEEFRPISTEKLEGHEIVIKDSGVYVITGGTGGLGLEIAKYLTEKNSSDIPVKLALLNRTTMPSREEWERLVEDGSNEKLAKKLKKLLEIENSGAEIHCYGVDVSNPEEIGKVFTQLKEEHGKINGVIHAAGVAGDGFIFLKEEKIFDQVLSPKIDGTWLIAKAVEKEPLDFFIMFSSQTALFGGPGQGDYTAANSYLDSFAYYLSQKGLKALAINWPAWKETGMAKDYGVTDDGIFKSLSTEKGLDIFDELLGSNLTRVIPAELNYSLLSSMAVKLPIKLSPQIQRKLNKDNITKPTSKKEKIENIKIEIKGKTESEFSETEKKLARIFGHVLETEEIDIYESFYDMGGDSILATQLLKELDKEFPDVVDISDIFSHPSVVQLAQYIDKKHGGEKDQLSDQEEKQPDQGAELKKLLDDLESGEIDIENSLKILNEMRSKGDE